MNKSVYLGHSMYRNIPHLTRRYKHVKIITLHDCLRNTSYPNRKSLIAFLDQAKQYGYIFYADDLKALPLDQPFHMYHYSKKGTGGYQYAFPIPTDLYQRLKLTPFHLGWLSKFYISYYDVPFPLSREFIHWNYYVGKKFIWFYS